MRLPVCGAQEAGEFIVLNAAAYHAGYNLGFNCAGALRGWWAAAPTLCQAHGVQPLLPALCESAAGPEQDGNTR